jgi:hypothetical protein
MSTISVGRRPQQLSCWRACVLLTLAPAPALAMHIAEDIITGWPVLAHMVIGIALD